MLGFGMAPLGTSLLGSGTVDQANITTPSLYGGEEAPAFTLYGDNPLDGYGRVQGWSLTKHKVYLALFTERGSASDKTFGRAPFPLVIRDDTSEAVKASVRKALERMTKAKEISIDMIEVRTGGERLQINLFFTDLRTRQKDSLSLLKGNG